MIWGYPYFWKHPVRLCDVFVGGLHKIHLSAKAGCFHHCCLAELHRWLPSSVQVPAHCGVSVKLPRRACMWVFPKHWCRVQVLSTTNYPESEQEILNTKNARVITFVTVIRLDTKLSVSSAIPNCHLASEGSFKAAKDLQSIHCQQ